jgi:hypothetical protein
VLPVRSEGEVLPVRFEGEVLPVRFEGTTGPYPVLIGKPLVLGDRY